MLQMWDKENISQQPLVGFQPKTCLILVRFSNQYTKVRLLVH